MQVSEIVKQSGKTKEEVAEALGIPMEGSYWFAQVDDNVAVEYITAQGEPEVQASEDNAVEELSEPPVEASEPERKRAQFWSKSRSHFLPSRDDEDRDDIQFEDWRYITDDNSAEAKFLRSVDIRDRIGIREVIEEPYTDVDTAVEFQLWLEGLIYTGVDRTDGASREGVRCVAAMLSPADEQDMEPVDRNSPKQLVKAVVRSKKLNVEAFGN